MKVLRRFFVRFVASMTRRRDETRLREEVAEHLALQTAENIRTGLSPDEARRQAVLKFGAVEAVKEDYRDQKGLPILEHFLRDTRYAVRSLRKNPGFTAVAVLTLALGIGANTAVFTVVDTLLLRPPPFDHAERLHWIYDVNDDLGVTINNVMQPSPGNFVDWRSQSQSFDYMVAWRNWFFSVVEPGANSRVAEQVRGVSVSPGFFDMLGVKPALGRAFRPDEEKPGHSNVVVLTDGFWKRRFAADPGVIGKTVLIDGQPFSIVGVLPSYFYFLQPDFEMWMPLTVDGGFRSERSSHSIAVLARLAPNVGLSEAQSGLDRIAGNLARTYPETNAGWGARLRSVFPFNRDLRPSLGVLLGAVACVLLLACINVANLLLVRVGVRQREIAIRAAIGASRARLIRQMLTESAILAGVGAVAALFLANWSLALMRPLMPQVQRSGPLTLALDVRVLLFTLGVTFLTSLVFGLLPALQAGRIDYLRLSSPLGRQRRAGRALSIVEIAMSLMLLISAILLVRSLWNLQQINPGFRPERLLTMQVWLPETKYPNASSVSQFHQEVLSRLQAFPEVRSAAVVNTRPFLGWSLGARVDIPGRASRGRGDDPIVGCRVISPGYLAALGAPLVRGRSFAESDGPNSAGVALINEVMAQRFWPTEDPIGKSIRARSLGTTSAAPWWPDQLTDTFTIVGVVGDIREGRLSDQIEPVVYLSYLQSPSRYMHLLVRTQSTPANVANVVQREIRTVDPDLGVYDIQTMEEALSQAVAGPRFNSILLWVFAAVALILSAGGIYGVTSYAVTQRTREFAIRMAVGAQSSAIFGMVTREGLAIAMAGILLGVLGALLVGRSLASLLYGVEPTDAGAIVGGASVVLVVALFASWRPARRAARVDPLVALRYE